MRKWAGKRRRERTSVARAPIGAGAPPFPLCGVHLSSIVARPVPSYQAIQQRSSDERRTGLRCPQGQPGSRFLSAQTRSVRKNQVSCIRPTSLSARTGLRQGARQHPERRALRALTGPHVRRCAAQRASPCAARSIEHRAAIALALSARLAAEKGRADERGGLADSTRRPRACCGSLTRQRSGLERIKTQQNRTEDPGKGNQRSDHAPLMKRGESCLRVVRAHQFTIAVTETPATLAVHASSRKSEEVRKSRSRGAVSSSSLWSEGVGLSPPALSAAGRPGAPRSRSTDSLNLH